VFTLPSATRTAFLEKEKKRGTKEKTKKKI
jgi:hypothetical protein